MRPRWPNRDDLGREEWLCGGERPRFYLRVCERHRCKYRKPLLSIVVDAIGQLLETRGLVSMCFSAPSDWFYRMANG
jgi:hypothetical protein